MPVIIHAGNDGDAVSGRLVVRPETSGSGITNTYSTPITLPSGRAADGVSLHHGALVHHADSR